MDAEAGIWATRPSVAGRRYKDGLFSGLCHSQRAGCAHVRRRRMVNTAWMNAVDAEGAMVSHRRVAARDCGPFEARAME